MHLEHLKGLLDQVTKVGSLALAVVNLVTKVLVLDLEKVKNWKDLSIVGYESFADGVGAAHEGL